MEYIGWIGALLFIISYLLLSLEYLSAQKYLYHILNAIGAFCLVFNATSIEDYPNIFVNAVWGLIAIVAAVKRMQPTKKRKSRSEV